MNVSIQQCCMYYVSYAALYFHWTDSTASLKVNIFDKCLGKSARWIDPVVTLYGGEPNVGLPRWPRYWRICPNIHGMQLMTGKVYFEEDWVLRVSNAR